MAEKPSKLCMQLPLTRARKWKKLCQHLALTSARLCFFHLRALVNGKCLHSCEAPRAGPGGMRKARDASRQTSWVHYERPLGCIVVFRARPLLCDTRSTCPTAVDKRPHPPRRPSRASALSRAAALASPSCATTLRCQRYGQSAVRFQGRGCQSKNQDDSFWEYAFWKQLMTQPST